MRHTGFKSCFRAPLAGAFLSLLPALAAAVECPADRIDERAAVDAVSDGDTVRLDDGRHVRFVGINTPELARESRPAEPFSEEAHQALLDLIERGNGEIALRLGEEERDRYGRLLAHPYLPDGRSITRLLLERGMGLRVAVPPNVRHQDCYARAEQAAREAGRGVWSGSLYDGTPAADLPAGAGGFHVVTGRIQRVGEGSEAYWFDLGGLTLRLDKSDLPYFDDIDPHAREGERLRVRGWIYRVQFDPRMDLEHPAAVEWLGE